MQNETTRNWFRMVLVALVPSLLVGIAALALTASPGETADAAELPSTTTTLAVEETTSEPVDAPSTTIPDNDPEPEPADEPVQEDEPEPLEPATLEMPESVAVEGGEAIFTISNGGDETLEIFLVDVNGNPIEVSDVATEVPGGEDTQVVLTVDNSGLPFGPYEMDVSVATSAGVGQITVTGTKFAILIPLLPDLDISTNYVVPHQTNGLEVKIVNNEDHDVQINLASDEDRLTFEDEVTLVPGDNWVFVSIQALPVPANVIDVLYLTVSFGETELETVTITKHGS